MHYYYTNPTQSDLSSAWSTSVQLANLFTGQSSKVCVHLASEMIRGNPKDCPGEQVPEKQITQTAHGCVVTSCAADLTVTSVMSTINLLTFWNQEFSTHSHLYPIVQPGNSSACKKKRAFWGADVAVAWVIVRPRQLRNTPLYALIIIKGALILRIATPDIYRSLLSRSSLPQNSWASYPVIFHDLPGVISVFCLCVRCGKQYNCLLWLLHCDRCLNESLWICMPYWKKFEVEISWSTDSLVRRKLITGCSISITKIYWFQ